MEMSEEIQELLQKYRTHSRSGVKHKCDPMSDSDLIFNIDDIIDVSEINMDNDQTWLCTSSDDVDCDALLDENEVRQFLYDEVKYNTNNLSKQIRELSKLQHCKNIDSRTFTRPKKKLNRASIEKYNEDYFIEENKADKNSLSEEIDQYISNSYNLSEEYDSYDLDKPVHFDLSQPTSGSFFEKILNTSADLDSFQNMSPPSLVNSMCSSTFNNLMENSYIKNDPVLREIRDSDFSGILLQDADPPLFQSFTESCSSITSDSAENFLRRTLNTLNGTFKTESDYKSMQEDSDSQYTDANTRNGSSTDGSNNFGTTHTTKHSIENIDPNINISTTVFNGTFRKNNKLNNTYQKMCDNITSQDLNNIQDFNKSIDFNNSSHDLNLTRDINNAHKLNEPNNIPDLNVTRNLNKSHEINVTRGFNNTRQIFESNKTQPIIINQHDLNLTQVLNKTDDLHISEFKKSHEIIINQQLHDLNLTTDLNKTHEIINQQLHDLNSTQVLNKTDDLQKERKINEFKKSHEIIINQQLHDLNLTQDLNKTHGIINQQLHDLNVTKDLNQTDDLQKRREIFELKKTHEIIINQQLHDLNLTQDLNKTHEIINQQLHDLNVIQDLNITHEIINQQRHDLNLTKDLDKTHKIINQQLHDLNLTKDLIKTQEIKQLHDLNLTHDLNNTHEIMNQQLHDLNLTKYLIKTQETVNQQLHDLNLTTHLNKTQEVINQQLHNLNLTPDLNKTHEIINQQLHDLNLTKDLDKSHAIINQQVYDLNLTRDNLQELNKTHDVAKTTKINKSIELNKTHDVINPIEFNKPRDILNGTIIKTKLNKPLIDADDDEEVDQKRINDQINKRLSCNVDEERLIIKNNRLSLGSTDSLDRMSSVSNSSRDSGKMRLIDVDAMAEEQERSLLVMSTPKPAKSLQKLFDHSHLSPIPVLNLKQHLSDSEISSDEYVSVRSRDSAYAGKLGGRDARSLNNLRMTSDSIKPRCVNTIPAKTNLKGFNSKLKGSYGDIKAPTQLRSSYSNLKTLNPNLKGSYTSLKPVNSNLPNIQTNAPQQQVFKVPQTKQPVAYNSFVKQATNEVNTTFVKPPARLSALPRPVSSSTTGIPRPSSKIPAPKSARGASSKLLRSKTYTSSNHGFY